MQVPIWWEKKYSQCHTCFPYKATCCHYSLPHTIWQLADAIKHPNEWGVNDTAFLPHSKGMYFNVLLPYNLWLSCVEFRWTVQFVNRKAWEGSVLVLTFFKLDAFHLLIWKKIKYNSLVKSANYNRNYLKSSQIFSVNKLASKHVSGNLYSLCCLPMKVYNLMLADNLWVKYNTVDFFG